VRDASHRIPDRAPARRLDRVLRELHSGASWNELRRAITTGKVFVAGARVTDPGALVPGGTSIQIRMAAPGHAGSPPALSPAALIHVDAQLVVVDKPAGTSTVAFNAEETDSLDQLVHRLLERSDRRRSPPLGVVHRLDRETSGLVVFARTLAAKRRLKEQFRFHAATRRYLAIAHGELDVRTIHSRLVRDRGDGLRGSTPNLELGRPATTHVKPLRRLCGATLIECTLETGRTHQIRIHLSEAGHPLVGERVYTRGYAGQQLPAPRVMLHAAELGVVHPTNRRALHFSSPMPEDFAGVLERLRARAKIKETKS
jgi:23S rRNA pseudouridine1911/1915/1917 synthase